MDDGWVDPLGDHDEYTGRDELQCCLDTLYDEAFGQNEIVDELKREDADFLLLLLSRFPQLASEKTVELGCLGDMYPLFALVLLPLPFTPEEIHQVYQLYPEAVLCNPQVAPLVQAGYNPFDVLLLWKLNVTLDDKNTKLSLKANHCNFSASHVDAISPLFPAIQSFKCETPEGFDNGTTMAHLCRSISASAVNLTSLQLDIPRDIFKGNGTAGITARGAFVQLLAECPLNHLTLHCTYKDGFEASKETTQALAEAIASRTVPIAYVQLRRFFLCPLAMDALWSILSAQHGAKRLYCSELYIDFDAARDWNYQGPISLHVLESKPCSLREFVLSVRCSLPHMKALLSVLASNSSLQEIIIPSVEHEPFVGYKRQPDDFPITNEVVQLLQQCPRLQKLQLHHSLPANLQPVAAQLQYHTTLKELVLSTPNFEELPKTEQQLKSIVALLQDTNTTLTTCKIHVRAEGTKIETYLDRIDYWCKLNLAGREQAGDPELTLKALVELLWESQGMWGWVGYVKFERRKLSTYYDLLRQNPLLWSRTSG